MVLSLVIGILAGGTVYAQEPPHEALGQVSQQDRGPLTSNLIEGVPYIRWGEAAQWEYPHKDVLDPASVAVNQMQFAYSGRDFVAEWRAKVVDDTRFKSIQGEDGTLDDLKSAIDRRVPVFVKMATTSSAHRLYFQVLLWARIKDVELTETRGGSGSLGKMIPFVPAAITELRRAHEAFDGYWLSHAALAHMLKDSDGRNVRREADKEERRAKSLCSKKAYRRVVAEVARDFAVIGCEGERLGWFRP